MTLEATRDDLLQFNLDSAVNDNRYAVFRQAILGEFTERSRQTSQRRLTEYLFRHVRHPRQQRRLGAVHGHSPPPANPERDCNSAYLRPLLHVAVLGAAAQAQEGPLVSGSIQLRTSPKIRWQCFISSATVTEPTSSVTAFAASNARAQKDVPVGVLCSALRRLQRELPRCVDCIPSRSFRITSPRSEGLPVRDTHIRMGVELELVHIFVKLFIE